MSFCGAVLGCVANGNKTRSVVTIFLFYLGVAILIDSCIGIAALIFQHQTLDPDLKNLAADIKDDLETPNKVLLSYFINLVCKRTFYYDGLIFI